MHVTVNIWFSRPASDIRPAKPNKLCKKSGASEPRSCCLTWSESVGSIEGETHLGGGLDTNGSTESFELVTEENGEGKGKTDSEWIFSIWIQSDLIIQLGEIIKRSDKTRTSYSVTLFRSHFYFVFSLSAPSSEDEWVPLELCFGMPLFSSELNRRVCRKIASHKLCSSER